LSLFFHVLSIIISHLYPQKKSGTFETKISAAQDDDDDEDDEDMLDRMAQIQSTKGK
jgi:lauroyl/myristoyl acyltransferase